MRGNKPQVMSIDNEESLRQLRSGDIVLYRSQSNFPGRTEVKPLVVAGEIGIMDDLMLLERHGTIYDMINVYHLRPRSVSFVGDGTITFSDHARVLDRLEYSSLDYKLKEAQL